MTTTTMRFKEILKLACRSALWFKTKQNKHIAFKILKHVGNQSSLNPGDLFYRSVQACARVSSNGKYRYNSTGGNTVGMIHSLNESKSMQTSKLTSGLLVKMQVPNSKHQNCNSFQVFFPLLDLLIIIYKPSFKGSYKQINIYITKQVKTFRTL
jgi:hypothetical protein